MTTKRYDIFLEDLKIGTTELEKADAPMGVVFGQIQFNNIISGYDFFKKYCFENNIELADDYPEDKLISTRTIENLKVVNENGIEIKGIGNQISGMDEDEFEITLEGVAYPFFEEEFPQHVKSYNEQFKES
ncbi:hypothetical protein [Pedobacter cryotolerans]|uniref:Uncharacterized protein n=1 Tax=Pedobacter cryotolerans TaxID=2571270 RepID=A0A4U1C962_9SPHI|nr:hypothetical protein [Pedobacter cryotolerans]TKC02409.1 hypothetical protein FA045_03790 [Pedobacter cryotolerans]